MIEKTNKLTDDLNVSNFGHDKKRLNKAFDINTSVDNEKLKAPVDNLKITVLGLGGGGSNATRHMHSILEGVDFCCLNTDKQALDLCSNEAKTLLIGPKTTKGLGSGGDPSLGLAAAKESASEIQDLVADSDVVFIAAGLGGGTGTGATEQTAHIARNMGILSIAVVTTPFKFEGPQRLAISQTAATSVSKLVDATILISNERLLSFTKQDLTLLEAFELSNNVILNAVQSISDLIKKPGLINIDFADLCSVIRNAGISLISSATASGDLRAPTAIENAMHSPLLGEENIECAKGIIINITSSSSLKLSEYQLINNYVQEYIREDTKVILGTSIEEELEDNLKVTVILTGVDPAKAEEKSTTIPVQEHNASNRRSRFL